MSITPLLDQALDHYGAFYRVVDCEEHSVEYVASYIDEDTLVATSRTFVGQNDYEVALLGQGSSAARQPKRRSRFVSDVYLDSAFLRTVEWRGSHGAWELDLDIAESLRLEVAAHCPEPPAELHLIRDRHDGEFLGSVG